MVVLVVGLGAGGCGGGDERSAGRGGAGRVVGAGAGGCGRADDRSAVRAVTDRFVAAVESGDGVLACAQLSPDTRAELESQEQRPCREAISSLQLQGGSVTGVEVYALNAMV